MCSKHILLKCCAFLWTQIHSLFCQNPFFLHFSILARVRILIWVVQQSFAKLRIQFGFTTTFNEVFLSQKMVLKTLRHWIWAPQGILQGWTSCTSIRSNSSNTPPSLATICFGSHEYIKVRAILKLQIEKRKEYKFFCTSM